MNFRRKIFRMIFMNVLKMFNRYLEIKFCWLLSKKKKNYRSELFDEKFKIYYNKKLNY